MATSAASISFNLPDPPLEYSQKWANQFTFQLESLLNSLSQPSAQYTTATLDAVRSLDPETATLGDVATVLNTLINDLKVKGFLR